MQETKKCLNCGYDAHEGRLYRTETDYDGNTYEIEVCQYSRTGDLED